MRNKVAKKLRRIAEETTVGQSKHATKVMYKQLKKVHKSLNQIEKCQNQ